MRFTVIIFPYHIINNYEPEPHQLHAAFTGGDLGGGSIDTAELGGLAVGEGVHGVQGNVEATGGVVDGEDVDALAGVLELPAGAALGRVPAGDGLGSADVGELGDGALRLPALAGNEAVLAVGARHGGQGAGAVVVAGVVGDCIYVSGGGRGWMAGGETDRRWLRRPWPRRRR